MAKILVVDDDPAVRFTLGEILGESGHVFVGAASAREALTQLDGAEVVVTDYNMPEMTGMALLNVVREQAPDVPVVMITAHGSERLAVQAMKNGAHDYVAKPFDLDEVVAVIERAAETRTLRSENRRLAAEQAIGKRVVGEGAAMQRLLATIARVAPRDVTVLLRGETGTGKEIVASLLHAQSKRAKGPLVRFNCAAIPAELADAELFGHVKGAFTGAQDKRRGFVAQADGGTLVLDELGELPLPIQAKLLRFLQEGEIQPVGASRVEKVDVRVVASTHRDLQAEVKAGRFREDLYFRLAVVELVVPTLRERPEDIEPLAIEFARRYREKFGLGTATLAPALLARLRRSSWPGNVRQLENTIARLVALAGDGEIGDDALGPLTEESAGAPAQPELEMGSLDEGPSLKEQVEAFERNLIARALAAAGGNQSEAARRLSTSRVTLVDKIKRFGLKA
jgi:two-component system response regulator AtoC